MTRRPKILTTLSLACAIAPAVAADLATSGASVDGQSASTITAARGLAPAPAAAPQLAPPHVVYYFDEPRELTLDPTRVAVFASGVRDLRSEDAGLAPGGRVSATALPDVFLADVAPEDQTRAGVDAAIARASSTRSNAVRFVSPVFIGSDGGPVFPTPALLVRAEPGADADALEARLNAYGTVIERDWGGAPGAFRVQTNRRDGSAVIADAAELAQLDGVLYAEPDMAFTGGSALTPNDGQFLGAWGLFNFGQNVFGSTGIADIDMNAPEAWDITIGDPSIITLVIDVGVQQGNVDIKQLPGVDLTNAPGVDGGPGNVCDNHGTPVSGCISGRINNFLGACGIAPNTNTVSARCFISDLDCSGNWTTIISSTVDALAHAESIGARVTNNSNYYGFMSAAIASKYADTRNAGMVHFAAAGNDGGGPIAYPASLPTVNAIGAITNRGNRSGFSNVGPGLAFAAPGSDVITTDRTGGQGYDGTDYVFIDGTSFASPYAAGVAALILSVNPGLSAEQVEQVMRDTVKDLGDPGFDEDFGWGLPDAHAALLLAQTITSCAADIDGDGDADPDDIAAFVSAFIASDPAADIDNDGDEDPDDIAAFVTAFIAGC